MAAEVVHLQDAATGASAEVLVSLGFNCFSLKVPFPGEERPRNLVWSQPGFETGEMRPSSCGVPVLFPFPGRIAGQTFAYRGKQYELDTTDAFGNAIHGFCHKRAWRVTDATADSVTAVFRQAEQAPETVGRWPSEFEVEATYRLSGRSLVFDFRATNTGDEPMPLGLGTHAYLDLGFGEAGDPEAIAASVAVDAEWLMERMNVTGETTPIAADHPLVVGAPIAGAVYDTPFRMAPGASATLLRDPVSGRAIRQTFDASMTCCVVYTPGHREAMCLEPYSCVPNPIAIEAAGIASGLRELAAGEAYATRITLEAVTE